MDNNKVLLSNLKAYQRIIKLIKIQEELAKNKVLKKAKANNVKPESFTAVNPII